jgi:hypothetical protein
MPCSLFNAHDSPAIAMAAIDTYVGKTSVFQQSVSL